MKQLKNANSKYENCCVCFPSDNQVISIIDDLLNKFKVILETHTNKSQPDVPYGKTQNVDFNRLIKMIFHKKFKNFKPTIACKHSHIRKNFITKLGVNGVDVDKISNTYAWKKAKYVFHLDTIVTQSKSFIRHAINNKTNKQQEEPEIQNSLSMQLKQKKSLALQLQTLHNKKVETEKRFAFSQDSKKQMGTYDQISYMWPFTWPSFTLFSFPNTSSIEKQQSTQKKYK